MKKYIKSSKVDTFLRYHDDETNWANNKEGFEKMYSILNKYDDSNGNDTVDIPFEKATPEDQDRMIELIVPKPKFGQPGYAKRLVWYAENPELSADNYFENLSSDYCEGVVDVVKALIAEGLIDEDYFE